MGALTQYYVDPAIAGNSGTGTIGDPFGDIQYAFNTVVRDATNGDQFNIKAGTAEILAAKLTLATYGTPTEGAPLVLRGYTSAANDGGIAEIDCNGYTMWTVNTYNFITMAWLYCHNFGNNNGIDLSSGNGHIVHCKVTKGASSPSSKNLITLGSSSTVIDSYIYTAGTGGVGVAQAQLVYGCYFYDCAGAAVYGPRLTERCIIVDCAVGVGLSLDHFMAIGNSVYSSTANTGIGIRALSGIYAPVIINNVVEGYNGAGGIPISIASDGCLVRNNALYNCNAEALGDAVMATASTVLSESPFVDAANGNFAIKPWLTSVVESAYPTSWYGPASTTNRADLGAVQNGATSTFISKFLRSRRLPYVNR